jgi:hypothetical protein
MLSRARDQRGPRPLRALRVPRIRDLSLPRSARTPASDARTAQPRTNSVKAHLARAHLCPPPALRRRDRAGTDEEILLAPRVLSSGASSQPSPPVPPAERAGCGLHRGVRDRRIQLPHSWVSRLTEELDAEIVERQAVASERRVVLTKTLTKLADERGKLLQAFYGNAIPLDLSKTEQDCIGIPSMRPRTSFRRQRATSRAGRTSSERVSGSPATATPIHEGATIRAATLQRRRARGVYIKDRKIGRAEFSEVFAPLFFRPSSNKGLKVEVRGFEPLTPAVRRQCSTGLSYTPGTAPG